MEIQIRSYYITLLIQVETKIDDVKPTVKFRGDLSTYMPLRNAADSAKLHLVW